MTYQINLAKIIKFLRISLGLSQERFSQTIGMNRLKLHRIENLKSEMSFEEWFAFSDHFGIKSDDVKLGYIERQERPTDKEAFSVSKRLQSHPYSSGRILSIYKWNFERLLGEKEFEEFCETEKMNSLFLTNLGSSLNMDFNLRLIESMILKGKLKTKMEVNQIAQATYRQAFHQTVNAQEMWEKKGIERISFFLNHQVEKYERNHQYEIKDLLISSKERSIAFSYHPKEHVNFPLYNRDYLKNFMQDFIESYMTTMSDVPCNVIKMREKKTSHDEVTFLIRERA